MCGKRFPLCSQRLIGVSEYAAFRSCPYQIDVLEIQPVPFCPVAGCGKQNPGFLRILGIFRIRRNRFQHTYIIGNSVLIEIQK